LILIVTYLLITCHAWLLQAPVAEVAGQLLSHQLHHSFFHHEATHHDTLRVPTSNQLEEMLFWVALFHRYAHMCVAYHAWLPLYQDLSAYETRAVTATCGHLLAPLDN
jgi:hypothetical protein